MALLQRLDIWIALGTLALLAYTELGLGRVVRPIAGWLWRAFWDRPEAPPAEPARRPRPSPSRRAQVRDQAGRFAGSFRVVSRAETRFGGVSGIAEPNDDAETVAFRFLARLVRAGHVPETVALECACGVRAGSSKAYQEARAKLKRAIEEEAGPSAELVPPARARASASR